MKYFYYFQLFIVATKPMEVPIAMNNKKNPKSDELIFVA
jgi:hypothetical protein